MFLIFDVNNELIGNTATDITDISDDVVIEITDAEYDANIATADQKMISDNGAVVLVDKYDLAELQAIKHDEIRVAFAVAEKLTVTDANSVSWSGGYDSALKIDGAKRMAELAGLATVEMFDDDNVSHVLTIADADVVVLTLGADYQTKFAQKQTFMVAVDVATDQADIDAIVVDFS